MFTVLVTGANAGIGLAVAAQLAAREDTHVLVAARSSEKAQGAVKELGAKASSSSKLTPVVLDLDDEASGEALRKQLEQQGVKLNVLVNNAAIAYDDDATAQRGLRSIMRSTFETNVFGTAHFTETMEPLLARGSVRPAIVNVSSELGSFALTQTFPVELQTKWLSYKMSKTALNVLTKHYATLYQDVRVVAVTPGYCATKLNNFHGTGTPESGAEIIVRAVVDTDGKTGIFTGGPGEYPW